MAMYSASLAPHIGAAPLWQRALAAYFADRPDLRRGDEPLRAAAAHEPGRRRSRISSASRLPVCVPWYLATWAGAVAGAAIPAGLALDFAVPVTFIALVAPALRSLPHLAAALVSVVVALALAWLPYNLWLIVAGGRGDGHRRAGRGLAGAAAMSETRADLDGDPGARARHLPDPLLLHRAGRRPAAAGLGDAAAALRAGGGDAGAGRAAGGLAAGDRRRSPTRRGMLAAVAALAIGAVDPQRARRRSPAAWRCSTWRSR